VEFVHQIVGVHDIPLAGFHSSVGEIHESVREVGEVRSVEDFEFFEHGEQDAKMLVLFVGNDPDHFVGAEIFEF